MSDSVGDDRRGFLATTAKVGMVGGLIAGYGAFAGVAGRYLYPARGRQSVRLFVAVADRIESGQSFAFLGPAGERIAIARRANEGTEEDFVALSSTCPHLGCQVHWEGDNKQFFCPCHNGTFDPVGNPTGGPPAKAQQKLARYPLSIEHGLLYIEVSV